MYTCGSADVDSPRGSVHKDTQHHRLLRYHDYCTLKIIFVDFEIEIHCSCYTILFCYHPNNLIYYTCPVAVKVAATFILFFPHLYIKFYICCELLNSINQPYRKQT